ncbi:hypothetical protein Peur_059920 [Populus x canadensis]
MLSFLFSRCNSYFNGIIATTDAIEACKGINIAVIVAGYSDNMERKDTLHENALLLKAHASALEHAAPDCQILMVANPVNTKALVLKEYLLLQSWIKNITCMPHQARPQQRALSHISDTLNVHVSDVKNVIIWGNHSSTQPSDANYTTVTANSTEKLVRELVADDHW